MKYISLDIETTGLDFENDKVLEISMILADTNCDYEIDTIDNLHSLTITNIPNTITARPFVLNMHKDSGLLDEIISKNKDGYKIEKDMTSLNEVVLSNLYRKPEIEEDFKYMLECTRFKLFDYFSNSNKSKVYTSSKNSKICKDDEDKLLHYHNIDRRSIVRFENLEVLLQTQFTINRWIEYLVYIKEIDIDEEKIVRVNLAGKNIASFDLRFLEGISLFRDYGYKMTKYEHSTVVNINKMSYRKRIIDPSILFMDKDDECLPSLDEIKKRIWGSDKKVSHRSYNDALDIIRILNLYKNTKE